MARALEINGKACQAEGEKHKWSNEKFHLENAPKLRGIYFIDPEDTELKETIKNARKKLETSVAPAMPCKIIKKCGSDGSNKSKTKLACILEADESTRMRMGNSIPHHHQDHGAVWKIQSFLLKGNLYGHPLAGLLWERQFEKVLLKHGWEKIPNWECLFCTS